MEIRGFIRSYQAIYKDVELEVVCKGEKPDYVVKDKKSGEELGVELTSVYLNDRSVPDEHIPPIPETLTTVGIPHDAGEIEEYKKRLIEAIKAKIEKSQDRIRLKSQVTSINPRKRISCDFYRHQGRMAEVGERQRNCFRHNAPLHSNRLLEPRQWRRVLREAWEINGRGLR